MLSLRRTLGADEPSPVTDEGRQASGNATNSVSLLKGLNLVNMKQFLVGVLLSVLVALVAARDVRVRRNSNSYSSSSSSSSSGGGGYSSPSGGGGYSAPSGGGGYSGPSGFGGGGFGFPNAGYGFSGGYNNGGFAFPNQPTYDFNTLYQQFLASMMAAQAYANVNPQYNTFYQEQLEQLALAQKDAKTKYPSLFPDSNTLDNRFGSSSNGPVSASASAHLGPSGGYGQAAVSPGGPDGLGVRFGQELPPASNGGSISTFSSSSSSNSNVDGKQTSHKTASFGVNDNGKITFKTVSE